MSTFEALEPRQLFAAGALDATLGGDGSVDVRPNKHAWTAAGTDVAVDDAGRTLVAAVYGGKHNQLSVTRLRADGSVDASFGDAGIAAMPLPGGRAGALQIAVDHRGRVLVLLGSTITRITGAGAADQKFGRRGTAAVPVLASGFAADLTVDAANNPLIVGTANGKAGSRAAIVKLTYRGKADAAFGTGGAYKTPVPQDRAFKEPGDATGEALRVQADGRIVGLAHVRYAYKANDQGTSGNPFQTVGESAFRLNADGSLDTSYGSKGTAALTENGDDESFPNAYVESFASDGRLILHTDLPSDKDPPAADRRSARVAIDANGHSKAVDLSALPAGATADGVSLFATQADGKYLFLSSDPTLYRLNADFTFDRSLAYGFAGGGRALDHLGEREPGIRHRSEIRRRRRESGHVDDVDGAGHRRLNGPGGRVGGAAPRRFAAARGGVAGAGRACRAGGRLYNRPPRGKWAAVEVRSLTESTPPLTTA